MANERKTMNEIITEANLKGETLSNANNFAQFLESEGMLAGGEHGAVTYNGKIVCYMHIDGNDEVPGPWTVWPDGDYSTDSDDLSLCDKNKEIAWANINICGDCGGKCAPGSTKTIFGKQLDNVCGAVLAFCDPKGEALECLKEVLKIRKNSLK